MSRQAYMYGCTSLYDGEQVEVLTEAGANALVLRADGEKWWVSRAHVHDQPKVDLEKLRDVLIGDGQKPEEMAETDMVNHPPHYNGHPKGIEAIDYIEDNPYPNLANAQRYLHRVSWGGKWDNFEDMKKAIWYVEREIQRRENSSDPALKS